MAKILLVEDDALIADSVVDALTAGGYTLEAVDNGNEGFDRLRLYHYDLAILDWNLPGLSGPEVLKKLRAAGTTTPVLMLTARREEAEKIEGLDSGADDYLTKPFSIKELSARIRALLRRPAQSFQNELKLGDLVIDPTACKAHRGGKEIDLLPKESAVLEFLIRHPNQLFDADQLLNYVWSSESDSSPEAVRQCIARLRKKLEVPGRKSPIVTLKGAGYRIEEVN